MLLGTVIEGGGWAAEPLPSTVRIDIPRGSLPEALSALSRQTGISVGMGGELPTATVRAVRGKMSASEALRKMLRGTGLQAIPTGSLSFRLEAVARLAKADGVPSTEAAEDIVVTGAKREQNLSTIPVSIAVVPMDRAGFLAPLAHSNDIATSVEGLTVTNEGAGRNRQFIRGVADSPFSGTGQSTVAIQLNDARIAYDAPDPDLRLVDVDRVEILKGPQGPLYGSGALGGVYHIVTKAPQLDHFAGSAEIHGQIVTTGAFGLAGQAMVNLPIAKDRLAVRAVAYRDFEPGWIDNDDGRLNSNNTHVAGERIAVRWLPSEDWTLDVMAVSQRLNQNDTQYVMRSAESSSRPSQFPEPHDNDFRMAAATLTGRVGDISFTSASSIVDHQIDGALDASASAGAFGLSGAVRYVDRRTYTVLNQEFRLSHTNAEGLSWIAGLSLMQAESNFNGKLEQPATNLRVVAIHQETTELAAFAELLLPIAEKWTLTAGGRLFRSIARDEKSDIASPLAERQIKNGFTPSIGVSWEPSDQQFWYLRIAGALRPGGLSPSTTSEESRFASDELTNIDIGWRIRPASKELSLDGALYASFWDHIQSDFLLPNGLVATHNVGDGRIVGIENTLRWSVRPDMVVEAGFTVQRARLTKATVATVVPGDARLPVVPDLSGRFGISRRFAIGDWEGNARLHANYFGSSRLSFDQGLDRHMGNYATADVSAVLSRGSWTVSGRVENLLNAHADSFAFGNAFSIRSAPQFTPLKPRTFIIGLERHW